LLKHNQKGEAIMSKESTSNGLDQAKAEAFAARLVEMLNNGAVACIHQ